MPAGDKLDLVCREGIYDEDIALHQHDQEEFHVRDTSRTSSSYAVASPRHEEENLLCAVEVTVPPARSAQAKEVALFFLAAAGSTIGWTAVLSNLVYWTDSLGVESFLYLNLAVYLPLFPIFLAQALYDSHYDRLYQSQRSFFFRGTLSFLLTLVAVGLIPLARHNLMFLSTIALVLGTASAVLHGTLKQMASFVYPHCERLPAAVASGMQASAVLVLSVTLATGFGHCGDSSNLTVFFTAIAVMVAICWASFQALMSSSPAVEQSLSRRDYSPHHGGGDGGDLVEPLLSATTEEGEEEQQQQRRGHDESPRPGDEVAYRELWISTWQACVALMVTVGSSMAVASWFNRVQSEDPTNLSLPQVLFYVRVCADLLGRPATIFFPIKSIRCIGVMAVVRISIVPIFFIYCSTDIIPKNDALLTICVALFAFSSGYLATSCYQLAPALMTEDLQQVSTSSKLAGLLNVCFAASALLGLLLSFLFA